MKETALAENVWGVRCLMCPQDRFPPPPTTVRREEASLYNHFLNICFISELNVLIHADRI